jgi:hypothetical protein
MGRGRRGHRGEAEMVVRAAGDVDGVRSAGLYHLDDLVRRRSNRTPARRRRWGAGYLSSHKASTRSLFSRTSRRLGSRTGQPVAHGVGVHVKPRGRRLDSLPGLEEVNTVCSRSAKRSSKSFEDAADRLDSVPVTPGLQPIHRPPHSQLPEQAAWLQPPARLPLPKRLMSHRKMACLASVISAMARSGRRTWCSTPVSQTTSSCGRERKRFASAELDLSGGNGGLSLPHTRSTPAQARRP